MQGGKLPSHSLEALVCFEVADLSKFLVALVTYEHPSGKSATVTRGSRVEKLTEHRRDYAERWTSNVACNHSAG